MGCVNKYMAATHGCQVLAGTRSNHTAEEEPDLGEPSEPLQNKHGGGVWTHRLTQRLGGWEEGRGWGGVWVGVEALETQIPVSAAMRRTSTPAGSSSSR